MAILTVRRARGAAAGLLILAVGAGPVAAADPPATLRLATLTGDAGPFADLVRSFADDVAARTEGSVIIEPVWSAAGDLPLGGDDRVVVGRVLSGELDMVLAPSRGFDQVGTTALQAIQTPFLIDNDALAAAVATGPVGDALLAALEPAGMVGLAMWPDGLRHLLTFLPHPEPFLHPEDLVGTRIRSVTSDVSWALMKAYGVAEVSQRNGFQDTDYDGEEQGLDGRGEIDRTATGNVTLFPRMEVLAIDDAAYARLTPAQQDAVRAASLALRDRATALQVPESAAGAAFCADGGRIVHADAAGLAAFVEGARPVIERLETGPDTADHVAAIAALKATVPASPGAAACEPPPLVVASLAPSAWEPAPAPDGVYRAVMTFDEVEGSAGTWTWIVDGGESTIEWSGAPGEQCRPTTSLVDGAWRLTFGADSFCLQEVVDLRWEPADGGIQVTLLRILPRSLDPIERPWYERFWERIE